jgi:hypothetical protein
MGPFLGSPTESETNENTPIEPRALGEQDLHQDIKSKNLFVRDWHIGTWQDLLGLHQQKELILKAPHHGSSTFDFLSSLYAVSDPVETKQFLASNRHVSALLFAALPKVKEAWGNDIKAELHLLEDPDDDSTSLNVVIRSHNPNAFDALNQFDEMWWFDHVGDAEGLLNFSVQPA